MIFDLQAWSGTLQPASWPPVNGQQIAQACSERRERQAYTDDISSSPLREALIISATATKLAASILDT